jgi:pSer/pThr/pTyr-binding forkhead associated (FHA) protein
VSDNGAFVVRDLGSHNGTFVNGKRVAKDGSRLRDGDDVQIGETHIRVSVQGDLKAPRAPLRFGWPQAVMAALVLAGVGGYFWRQRALDQEQRLRYLTGLRDHLRRSPCAADPFDEIKALDQQIAGRSFAIGLAKGELKISPRDEQDDRALLETYRKRLAAFTRLTRSLTDAQHEERESEEKLSRLGARFSSERDRKMALWAEGILKDREKAGDDLLLGVQSVQAQNQGLVSLVEAVVVRHEAARAQALSQFRFSGDLSQYQKACEAQAARVAAAASGAFSALDE